jgi:ABC-type lipoprotein release transport system permease subunit
MIETVIGAVIGVIGGIVGTLLGVAVTYAFTLRHERIKNQKASKQLAAILIIEIISQAKYISETITVINRNRCNASKITR